MAFHLSNRKEVMNSELELVNKRYVSRDVFEFVMDSESDLGDLPGINDILPGSVAYTADLSKIYVLSPSDTWTEVG